MPKSGECVCSNCKRVFIPSFAFDFYPEPTKEDKNAGLCENCFMNKAFSGKTVVSIEPVPVPAGYKDAVCKKGKGKVTCSFLGFGENGFTCFKGSSMVGYQGKTSRWLNESQGR